MFKKRSDKVPCVCFVGQQWSRHLADLINKYSNDQLHATFLVMDSLWKVLKLRSQLSKSDIWVRVGVRPGSPSARGLLFDTLWWFLQKYHQGLAVYYWIGTDVLQASDDTKRSCLTPFFRVSLNNVHLAGAPWLVEELQAIGVPASCVLFPSLLPTMTPPPLPRVFTVASYIPDWRSEFYGGPLVYEAACRIPFARFLVWGGSGSWVSRPLPNLHFLGWVTDVAQVYTQASVILRLVKHDGLGASVREGLALARHVIYTYKVPYTLHVPFDDKETLIECLEVLYQRHQRGQLGLNWEGREYALEAWNPKKLAEIFIQTLLDLFRKRYQDGSIGTIE